MKRRLDWLMVGGLVTIGVTDAEGHVIMTHVPEGTYTMRVWHETLGEHSQPIEVKTGPMRVTIRMNRRGTT